MNNDTIAEKLLELADYLGEQEENPWRIKAYKRAARSIKKYPEQISVLLEKKIDLSIIPYVGKNISEVITKLCQTGEITFPKSKSAEIYPKKLSEKKRRPSQFKIYTITPVIEKIMKKLKSIPAIKNAICAGDYRRKSELVSDLEIIMVTDDSENLFSKIHLIPSIKYIIETKFNYTLVELKIGLRIKFIIVDKNEFAPALLKATGSESHYDQLRARATKFGMDLKENSVIVNKKLLKCSTEKDIYRFLKLEYIPPELRENRGEIDSAAKNEIPNLIELTDIKGDLHCHTNETDGNHTLEEMVFSAQARGYEYVAITDHSQSLKITNGMNETRLLKQIEQINKLNQKLRNFTILKSMEIDILEDGSLDLSNEVLRELDLTVCSVHSRFGLSLIKQTERIIRAMDNPYFNILGHATGRLLQHRKPYEIDIEKILIAARDRHCFIEINSQPARLDINDIYCKRAREIGVKLSISSDAHTIHGFSFMQLGVNQARRGWLEAKDVINTYSLHKLKKLLIKP